MRTTHPGTLPLRNASDPFWVNRSLWILLAAKYKMNMKINKYHNKETFRHNTAHFKVATSSYMGFVFSQNGAWSLPEERGDTLLLLSMVSASIEVGGPNCFTHFRIEMYKYPSPFPIQIPIPGLWVVHPISYYYLWPSLLVLQSLLCSLGQDKLFQKHE